MQFYLERKNIFTALFFSFTYVFLGYLSINYVTMPSGIAIAWLPNSMLLAFFLIKDKKEWKYFIPFFLLAEVVADYGVFTTIEALQFGVVNVLETSIAAFIIKKFSKNNEQNFTNTKYFLAFFLVGLNIMPMIGAIFGALIYYTQIGSDASFIEFWRIWYFGDAVGILLLTPIMVIFKENYKSLKSYEFDFQNISIVGFSIYLAIMLFSFSDSNLLPPTTPLIFILLLLWVVYKQGILPALILAFFISLISIYYTSDLIGPFSIFGAKETTIYLQEFIALLFIITLFFGVLHKELVYSKQELEELNNTLEMKIQQKTQSLVQANKKLNHLASKDSLTNIFNRRMINEYLFQEISKSKRHKNDTSLIMIDIDHFKEVNDHYGHQVGDKVIVKSVELISSSIRASDIFGRWGGEEFIILLPQTDLKSAFVLAQNLRQKVQDHDFEQVGKKTISVGVTQLNADDDVLSFVRRSDDALYKAKKSGRNKVVSI
ncbi:MAG: diguanylate cyclase [Sulfurimonas sp.]|uniref:sensor domain-containing diguanylate cyclase n=1 Tax=Sulfurimonas sp. TaxID=2022749 RepID=UPI0025FBA819|nr:diguanylate cyclase [Sulfurimonas sp.]MCK9492213.1 diguanylate cyclase [Sulfurimonas sp.]